MGRPKSPRDDQGWAVPNIGTRSRIVYDVLVAALQSGEGVDVGRLAYCAGLSRDSVYVLIHRIRRPGARRIQPRG